MDIKTYAMSFMSRWQSAVLSVIKDDEGDAEHLATEHPVMAASCEACEVMEEASKAGHNPLDFAADVSKMDLVTSCAKLYVGLAAAKVMGNTERARELESELQYSTCDPLWAKALLEFDSNEAKTPYRHYDSIDDFVLPLEPTVNVGGQADALKLSLIHI